MQSTIGAAFVTQTIDISEEGEEEDVVKFEIWYVSLLISILDLYKFSAVFSQERYDVGKEGLCCKSLSSNYHS